MGEKKEFKEERKSEANTKPLLSLDNRVLIDTFAALDVDVLVVLSSWAAGRFVGEKGLLTPEKANTLGMIIIQIEK